jgi:two-component system sensor histidine kinase PilS (NtrC family)
MSHAAQLLAESPVLSGEDRRLTEIMQVNSTRVSTIIDNILQLSRREALRPEQLQLGSGPTLSRRILRHRAIAGAGIVVHGAPRTSEVRIDGSQLHQIFWNLCQNSVTHALPHAGEGEGSDRAALRPTCAA